MSSILTTSQKLAVMTPQASWTSPLRTTLVLEHVEPATYHTATAISWQRVVVASASRAGRQESRNTSPGEVLVQAAGTDHSAHLAGHKARALHVNLHARKFLSSSLPTTTAQQQPWPTPSTTSPPGLAKPPTEGPGFTEFGPPFQCLVHNFLALAMTSRRRS